MPLFYYTAKNLDGESKTGEMEAKDERDLSALLKQGGYFLLTSSFQDEAKKKGQFDILHALTSFQGVSLKDKVFFTRNLAIMLKAGVPIIRALNLLGRQTSSGKFRRVIAQCEEEVGRGNALSQAFAKHPGAFSELFVNMIKVGEEGGSIDDILNLLADQLEKENKLRNKVMGAMLYPAIILCAMAGIGVFMMINVVPMLSQTFKDFDLELPITTQVVLLMSNLLAKFWYLLPAVIVLFVIFFRFATRLPMIKKISNAMSMRVPLIGTLVRQFNAAITARTLSSLIRGGVSIVKSLEITSRVLKNYFYRDSLVKISKEIEKGKNISELLEKYENIYPALMVEMIKVGEETGKLSDMLENVAVFYEDEVARATENLSTIIEPVLMIFIGGAVGFFAVSMIQPMYSMLGAIQ